jgi:hypothetical protein
VFYGKAGVMQKGFERCMSIQELGRISKVLFRKEEDYYYSIHDTEE